MSFSNDMRMAFTGTYRGLNRLLFLLVVVFLLINIGDALQLMNKGRQIHSVSLYLSIPGWFQDFLAQGWSLLTYMFTHESLLHLLGNVLWLYSFGRMFTDLLGGSRMLGLFVLGGLCGGIFFLILAQLVPAFRDFHLLGASAGAMAVVIATAAYRPEQVVSLFGVWQIRLKYLALISFVFFSLLNLSDNTGGKVAHIGGSLMGLIYGWQMRKKNGMLESFMKLFRKADGTKLKVVHRRPVSDEVFHDTRVNRRKKIDEILDKISRSGYDSLNPEEKKYLQENHDKT